jgi:hypothetical protein
MIQMLIALVLLAIAGYVAWKSKTPEGWDWKLGLAALGSLAAAIGAWFSDWTGF